MPQSLRALRSAVGAADRPPRPDWRGGEAVRAEQVRRGEAAVEVRHLRKQYGDTVAIDDISFSVSPGEAVGILGPNTVRTQCIQGRRSRSVRRPLSATS